MIGQVNFEQCELDAIPDTIFAVHENLYTLDIANLIVESSRRLNNFSASHNKITEVPKNLFHNTKNLVHLDL